MKGNATGLVGDGGRALRLQLVEVVACPIVQGWARIGSGWASGQ